MCLAAALTVALASSVAVPAASSAADCSYTTIASGSEPPVAARVTFDDFSQAIIRATPRG